MKEGTLVIDTGRPPHGRLIPIPNTYGLRVRSGSKPDYLTCYQPCRLTAETKKPEQP